MKKDVSSKKNQVDTDFLWGKIFFFISMSFLFKILRSYDF